jgi:hypothetical protein
MALAHFEGRPMNEWSAPEGSRVDRVDARWVVRDLYRTDAVKRRDKFASLERQTWRLIERWWPAIDVVAQALLQNQILGGDDVVRLVAQSMPELASSDMKGSPSK